MLIELQPESSRDGNRAQVILKTLCDGKEFMLQAGHEIGVIALKDSKVTQSIWDSRIMDGHGYWSRMSGSAFIK